MAVITLNAITLNGVDIAVGTVLAGLWPDQETDLIGSGDAEAIDIDDAGGGGLGGGSSASGSTFVAAFVDADGVSYSS